MAGRVLDAELGDAAAERQERRRRRTVRRARVPSRRRRRVTAPVRLAEVERAKRGLGSVRAAP